ncbi:MAG: EAL domain-containing protein [Actinobacteria bacterium]|nr:MAG: EAL domain-containing protein [Actinomycetota bacterium]
MSVALTGVAFALLYRLELVGDLPLVALLILLGVASAASEAAVRRWRDSPSPRQLHALVAVQMVGTTVIIYAIGWGPTLALGYLFILARDLEDVGSRAWRPALLWTVLSMAGGQAAIATGIAFTYVATPYVHGLAILAALGVAFVIHVLGTKTAIQEATDSELRMSEASFRQLFADNPQPMWVYEAETLAFLEVNEAAIRHYGYAREEFLDRHITDIRPVEDVPRLLADVAGERDALQQGAWRHRLKDGRVIDVEVRSHQLSFDSHDAVLVAVQDVTHRNALESELRHQAFHDSLTDLANRALFADRVDHAIRRQERDTTTVAVVVLDLDGFKTVNDSLGHTVGDELLVAVAARLEGCLRPGDTAARLGGDEFAILLEDLEEPEAADRLAQRIIDVLAPPFSLSGKEIFVHASLGISLAEGERESADELLRNADAAMYRAKGEGKGCYRLFDPAMHSAAMARLELEGDMRRAIDEGEFVLHYQPTVSLSTGKVMALEALVRWQHPTRGLIPPAEFIHLAEENGLIVEIGRWVLREACRRARYWQLAHRGYRLTIAVNLSARQLGDPRLVDDVSRVLHETGLEPSALTLEITESVLIADTEVAISRLHALKSLGVRLAIDDFGTGYSSLSSLRQLPVDTLKIDKAFIDGVTTGVEAAGLVQAIVRLAGTLELRTIAEGVERRDQVDRLEELGCSEVQGYHFSRPLAPDDVEAFLKTRGLDRAEAPATARLPGDELNAARS